MSNRVSFRVVGVREARRILENASRRYTNAVRTIEAAARRIRALAARTDVTRGGGP